MRDEITGFWRTLLVRLHEARHGGDLPPEEAERRMERAGRVRLPAGRIDAIVASVTGGTAPPEAPSRDEEQSEGQVRTPEVVPRRRPPIPFLPRRLAAALLVVGLVGLLVAGRLLVWPPARYPTQTMRFPRAVTLALDPGQPEEVRLPALGRTFGGVKAGLRCLFDLEQDSALGEQARALRAGLRAALARPAPEPSIPGGDVFELVQRAKDPNEPVGVRRDLLAELAQRAAIGIAALRHLATAPGKLGGTASIYVAKIRDDLAR